MPMIDPNLAQGIDFPPIFESQKWLDRARGLIPACTQTLAKGPTQFVQGVAPNFAIRGKGCRVWDADGNEYVDLSMGVGPLSLGYAYDRVDDAIRAQLADGITFSLVHPLEVEVAEMIREVVPCAQAVRYSKTGADATSAAVRLARAFTGRENVFCCGYHGWHDWYVGVTSRNKGVPDAVRKSVFTFEYNDLDAVSAGLGPDTACVILEPMVFEFPKDDFLARLRDLCRERGVLLIFDEMWTGFRWALGGAQEYFGVTPDLACFSKAVSNGMPLSILAGRADVMALLEEDVFFFTTFGGEALSLAAAKATMAEMKDKNVTSVLAERGLRLKDGYNRLASRLGLSERTWCQGHSARSLIQFNGGGQDPLLMKSLVQQEMIRRRVLWSGFHNLSFSHTPADLDRILQAYEETLFILKAGLEDAGLLRRFLKGTPVQQVFRKTSGFDTKPAPSAR